MAVIFQGEKIVDVGDNQYQYGGGSMIVTSVEVPTSYRILNASPERPFVSASRKLDRALLAEIMGEISGKKEFPLLKTAMLFASPRRRFKFQIAF